jgi:thiol-disulfide isomerase/thioredoxin
MFAAILLAALTSPAPALPGIDPPAVPNAPPPVPERAAEEADRARFVALIAAVDAAGGGAESPEAAAEAIATAARSALEEHAAALGAGEGLYHRSKLELRAKDHAKAYASLRAFLAAQRGSDLANDARCEAFYLGIGLQRDGAELLPLFDAIDVDALEPNFALRLAGSRGKLLEDFPREALNGKPAPAFDAQKVLNAESFDLAALRGKVVVLDFFATWCQPCRDATPELVKLQREKGEDLQVVGVTRLYGFGMDFSDPAAELPHGGKLVGRAPDPPLTAEEEFAVGEAFVTAFGLPYPVVFVGADVAAKKFHVRGIPTAFVLDRDGVVLGSAIGSSDAAKAKIDELITRALAAKPADDRR